MLPVISPRARARAVVFIALTLTLAMRPGPSPVFALIGEVPTIRDIAIGRPIFIDTCNIALLAEDATGAFHLIVRVIEDKTGKQIGTDLIVPLTLPPGVTPVDLVFSNVFRPGSVLVLDDTLRVHEFPLVGDADGSLKLVGDTPAIHGPFGDPALVGAGTAMAEAPNAADIKRPFLAIGTAAGRIIVTDLIVIDGCPIAGDPILDLSVVPQPGTFAFVALVSDKAGSHLIGVHPDNAETPALDPSVIFQLADPRPDPWLDLVCEASNRWPRQSLGSHSDRSPSSQTTGPACSTIPGST